MGSAPWPGRQVVFNFVTGPRSDVPARCVAELGDFDEPGGFPVGDSITQAGFKFVWEVVHVHHGIVSRMTRPSG
jgi:hypothetical protein